MKAQTAWVIGTAGFVVGVAAGHWRGGWHPAWPWVWPVLLAAAIGWTVWDLDRRPPFPAVPPPLDDCKLDIGN